MTIKRLARKCVSFILVFSMILAAMMTGVIFTSEKSYAAEVLQVTTGHSKEELVDSIVGSGVEVSNISFKGLATSAGIFTGGDGIIGFSEGVILSSGHAANSVEGQNNNSGSSMENGLSGDSDLNLLLEANGGGLSYDATILEFDFVPESDNISFQYVLGSEEYTEYLSYGDIFGLFVNGQNTAVIPDTTQAVSVKTVNPNKNSEYFIGNEDGHLNTQMDGLTLVFSISVPVNKGETNHLKLAMADMLDSSLDTNIFIKAGSISDEIAQPGEIAFDTKQEYEVTLKRIGGSDGAIYVDWKAKDDNGITVGTGKILFGDEEIEKKIIVPGDTNTIELSNPTGGAEISDGSQSKLLADIPDLIVDNTPPNAPNAPVSQSGPEINALESSGFDVKVELGTSEAQEGDEIELLVGGSSFDIVKKEMLSSVDISNGYYIFKGMNKTDFGMDGEYSLTSKITDVAGNEGPQSDSATIKLDTVAPAGTAISTPIGEDGIVNGNEKTDVSLEGKSEAQADVEVTIEDINGQKMTKTAKADSNGDWEVLQINLGGMADGELSIKAKATDAAGNEGSESIASVELDTVAPEKPIIATPIEEDGMVNKYEKAAVVISGTAEAEAGLEITIQDQNENKITKNIKADKDGVWTLQGGSEANLSAFSDGDISVIVNATDMAGNTSDDSLETFMMDTLLPEKPVIMIPIEEDGIVNGYEKSQVGISGTSEGNAKIDVIFTDGKSIMANTATADENGNWLLENMNLSSLDDGKISLKAIASDASGNKSEEMLEVFTMDKTAPNSQDKVLSSDRIVKGGIDISLDGGSESEDIVFIAPEGTSKEELNESETIKSVKGSEINITMPDVAGIYKIYVRDEAGNVSLPSKASIQVDNTPPNQPSILSVAGQSISPALDNDDTPDVFISGLSVGETVKVYAGGKEVASKAVSGPIQSITLGHLSEGNHVVTVKSVDAAGNQSLQSEEFEYIYDKTAPEKPVIESVSGKTQSPAVDNNQNPKIEISNLQAGDLVSIYEGDEIIETKLASASVQTMILTFDAEGNHILSVKSTDAAGNESSVSETFTYVYDVTPPGKPAAPYSEAAPYINYYEESDGFYIEIDLEGSGSKQGDTIELLLDGKPFEKPIIKLIDENDIKNGVMMRVESGQLGEDKIYSITSNITDIAGNKGLQSDQMNIELDTMKPANKVLLIDKAVQGGKTIVLDESSQADNSIFIAPEGTSWQEMMENDETITTSHGNRIDIKAPAREGKYKAYVVDKSENVSEASEGSIIVDNTPPVFEEIASSSEEWTSDDLEIMIELDDADGSGISVAKYVYGKVDSNYFLSGGSEIDDNRFDVEHNGLYTIYVADKAENEQIKTIEINNIDKEIPSKPIIIRNPDRDFYNDDYEIRILSGSDGGSGVSKTVYRTSGAVNISWRKYTGPINISESGTTQIETKTIDKAGNESETQKNIISINRKIHVFPTIKIYPDMEYSNEDYRIELLAGYDEGHVDESVYSNVYYKTTGIDDFELYDGPFSIEDEGQTEIQVKIIDRFGNENVISKTVNLDKTRPDSQNEVLRKGTRKRGGEEVVINPTGEESDVIWIAPEGTVVFGKGVNMTKANGGEHLIKAPEIEGEYKIFIVDRSGNISYPSDAVIIVDNTAPNVNGIQDGVIYKEYRTIIFEEGTAWLNGNEIESGTAVEENGEYVLEVKDDTGNARILSFVIDNDEEWVEKDQKSLEIGFSEGDNAKWVTGDIVLPLKGRYGSEISWRSSDEMLIATSGKVILPERDKGDTAVVLSATITKGNVVRNIAFELKVISDTVAPVITLEGESRIVLEKGDVYLEEGARAIDDKDGNISGKIEVAGYIDTDKTGTYAITYSVSDSTGNTASVQRIIEIVKSTISKNAVVEANNDEKISDRKIADAIDGAKQNDEDKIKIVVPYGVTTNRPVKVNISKEQVQNAKENGISLELETNNTAIELPVKAVDTSNMSNTSRLELICEQIDLTKEENKPMVEAVKDINENMGIYGAEIYDFKLKVVEEDENGNVISEKTIEDFTSSEEDLKLRIAVGKSVDENLKLMSFYYNEKTHVWEYIRGEYDIEAGEMNFFTNHLSIYSVMYLTKEEKQEEMARILNKEGITISEVLNVIEDTDMDFDSEAVEKYDSFTKTRRVDVAGEIITRRPGEGYDYLKLKQMYADVVFDMHDKIGKDNVKPLISLVGAEEISVKINNAYVELGATATDDEDGDITGRIVVTGRVDTSVADEYVLTYSVQDMNGNVAQTTRKVFVMRKNKNSNHAEDKKEETDMHSEVHSEKINITFKDMNEHWAKDKVEALAAKGIIIGDPNGKFNPDDGITRAEFAAIIAKSLNLKVEEKESGFEDIAEDDWYAPYIAAARKAGIVSGISETEYEPDRIVNRQEMTTMVMRAYRMLKDTEISDYDIGGLDMFSDSEQISSWANEDVYMAKRLKLIQGRNGQKFAPKDETLRAEAAVLIYNFLEALDQL